MESINAHIDKLFQDYHTETPEFKPTEAQILEIINGLAVYGYLPKDRASFIKLATWQAANITCLNPKRKGLLLTGKAGTGKTLFIKSLNLERYPTASELCEIYREQGGEYNNTFWRKACGCWDSESWAKSMAIDDLGQEATVNHFGTKSEIMDAVICQRYRDWQRKNVITAITTNLTPDELDKRYGRRITDRLREMCELIKIDGGSNR